MKAAVDERKEQDKEYKRRQISVAAARVFARKGYAGASMADLAAEAGCAAPTLYGYFEGKESIFRYMFVELTTEFRALFDVWIPEGLKLRDRLEILLRHMMEWFSNSREILIVLFDPALSEVRVKETGASSDLSLESVGLFERWLTQVGDLAELGDHPPRHLAWVLSGVCRAFVSESIAEPSDTPLPDRVPQLLDLLYYGLPGPKDS